MEKVGSKVIWKYNFYFFFMEDILKENKQGNLLVTYFYKPAYLLTNMKFISTAGSDEILKSLKKRNTYPK